MNANVETLKLYAVIFHNDHFGGSGVPRVARYFRESKMARAFASTITTTTVEVKDEMVKVLTFEGLTYTLGQEFTIW